MANLIHDILKSDVEALFRDLGKGELTRRPHHLNVNLHGISTPRLVGVGTIDRSAKLSSPQMYRDYAKSAPENWMPGLVSGAGKIWGLGAKKGATDGIPDLGHLHDNAYLRYGKYCRISTTSLAACHVVEEQDRQVACLVRRYRRVIGPSPSDPLRMAPMLLQNPFLA